MHACVFSFLSPLPSFLAVRAETGGMFGATGSAGKRFNRTARGPSTFQSAATLDIDPLATVEAFLRHSCNATSPRTP